MSFRATTPIKNEALKPVGIRSTIIVIVINWSSISRTLLTPPAALIVKLILILVVVVVIIVDLRSSSAIRPSHHRSDWHSLTCDLIVVLNIDICPRRNRIVARLNRASLRAISILALL